MVAASAWGAAATAPAAVNIAICQNRCLEMVVPAILALTTRCPLTRIFLKSGYSSPLFSQLFVVAKAKRVQQRRPSNFSDFRHDRSKKASHSVKPRRPDGTSGFPRYGPFAP